MDHSEKGLKTLELMGTKPKDWGLTPIKWVWKKMLHPVEKTCGGCRGRGRANTYPNNTFFLGESEVRKALKKKKSGYIGHLEIEDFKKKHGIEYRRCPICPQKTSRNFGSLEVGTGLVIVWEEQDVLVGFPIWPKGVQFDSRFYEAKYDRQGKFAGKEGNERVHSVCELCSKSIYGRWSFLVPVNARGKDGKCHGMYVGQDCAKKFLGLELVLDMNQLEEIKKSERKQHVRIEITRK